jgi:glycine oxidase
MSRGPDVVVVGGGLIGCLAARALAGDGRSVTLLEAGPALGRRASTAAAGMLSPQMEAAEGMLVEPGAERREAAMMALCLAARERWPDFVEELEAETGIDLHYRREGTLVVALTGEEADRLERQAEAQRGRGLRAEWRGPEEARALEPGLAPGNRGALELPDDRQVDPGPLMAAVVRSLERSPGVRVELGRPVTGIETRGGRATGVSTAVGPVAAELVVLAGGAWSGDVAGLPRPLAVRPVKGQMVALRPASVPIRHVVGGRGAYCVPRDDGRVVVGATVEEAGFDETVDPAAVEALVAAVAAAVPALAAAPLESRWAGLRPGTPDALPILGADPALPGLLYATGHYRNGILLAPLTGTVVAALAAGDPPPVDLAPFSPVRAALSTGPRRPATGE